MAKLWIREYKTVPQIGTPSYDALQARAGDGAPIPMEDGTAFDQPVVTFSTSVQSLPFKDDTRYVAISADANFHYVVSGNPTATVAARRVLAGETVFFGVVRGHKVAAIAAA